MGNVVESLPLPEAAFDLINGRLLSGFVLLKAWPWLLEERP
jgi:hypothetical protein